MRARYLDPTVRNFDHSVVGWLLAELPTATSFAFASGYVDASVLDWLEESISELRGRGGRAQALVGSNGGQTSATDVERLLAVVGDELYIEYAEGGIFHPKVYVVDQPGRVQAAVGSANFTTPGSLVNVEASLIVETDDIGPPPEEPLASIVASIQPAKYPHATQVRDQTDIDRLKRLGVIDRITRRSAVTVPSQSTASRQRRQRQNAGFARRGVVDGIPTPTRRRVVSTPTPALAQPVPAGSLSYCGLEFSSNDLKDVGTREISVSSGIRDWAEGVLGRAIQVGEGDLFDVEIDGRLGASPGNVLRTPEPVRIWAAGGSGGTHQDVRLVLGTSLKGELDDEATLITGLPIPAGSIGVFELPPDPATEAVRLTVFLPDDPEFTSLQQRLGTTGREQKAHFRTSTKPPELPDWPTLALP